MKDILWDFQAYCYEFVLVQSVCLISTVGPFISGKLANLKAIFSPIQIHFIYFFTEALSCLMPLL